MKLPLFTECFPPWLQRPIFVSWSSLACWVSAKQRSKGREGEDRERRWKLHSGRSSHILPHFLVMWLPRLKEFTAIALHIFLDNVCMKRQWLWWSAYFLQAKKTEKKRLKNTFHVGGLISEIGMSETVSKSGHAALFSCRIKSIIMCLISKK